VEPVVAGRVVADGPRLLFTYGASYRERLDAIALYEPELPLRAGTIAPPVELPLASCLRDAAPDAWGQRIILDRLTGVHGVASDLDQLPMLTYLREAGSDRIGGLDFQDSARDYTPRTETASFPQLLQAAADFAEGRAISGELADALVNGTSVGGARPKVLVREETVDGPREMIAKFSVAADPFPVIKAEAAAMSLARRVGLDVAGARYEPVLDRDVLLVDRFDRPGCVGSPPGTPGERRLMVSALTVLGGDERGIHQYLGYAELADEIRRRFTEPKATLRELFSRIVFNILISNTDDHARNHAAFWDGRALTLTPAYDLCPAARTGDTATQAMGIDRDHNRASRLGLCVASSDIYQLTSSAARDLIDAMVDTINDQWPDAADDAQLTQVERERLWNRQFLNPAIAYDDWT
jgi:serine/threonine-protein kinase HipA